jgi:hypothetical protein
MEKISSLSPIEYNFAIKNRGASNQVVAMGNLRGREEEAGATIRILKTMSEAIRACKVALADLRARLA